MSASAGEWNHGIFSEEDQVAAIPLDPIYHCESRWIPFTKRVPKGHTDREYLLDRQVIQINSDDHLRLHASVLHDVPLLRCP